MIAGLTYYEILEYFLIYSFLGWCTEVVYQAIAKGIVVNRGFLNGPVCPIYGFGVVGIFMLAYLAGSSGRIEETNGLAVFAGGVAFATLIELIGGWALDKLFHARWWDYSAKPFNFHGYICLEFSILWGLGIVFIVREVQPFMAELTARSIPERIGWPVMAVLYLIYAVDLVVSVLIMAGLNRQMAELDEMREKMRVVSNGLSTRLGEGALDAAQHLEEARVQAALAGKELRDNAEELKEQLESEHRENEARARAYREELEKQLEQSRLEFEAKREEFLQKASSGKFFGTGRILRAFPDMEHHEHGELLEMIREHMNETRKADK